MEVKFKKSFYKDLQQLPLGIQENVFETILTLKISDNIYTTNLDLTFLKGKHQNKFRIRIGNYRLGGELIKPDIILITIGSRGDFYKHFPIF